MNLNYGRAKRDGDTPRKQERERRKERVKQLYEDGYSRNEIVLITGYHYNTVKLYLQE